MLCLSPQCADTAGASVTIPHKQAVIPLLNELSVEAAAIGAVNTVIRRHDGTLYGHNTDWIGIQEPLQAALACLPPPRLPHAKHTVLVIGAGGTARAAAYAVTRMSDCRLLVFNRTTAKVRCLMDVSAVVPCSHTVVDVTGK